MASQTTAAGILVPVGRCAQVALQLEGSTERSLIEMQCGRRWHPSSGRYWPADVDTPVAPLSVTELFSDLECPSLNHGAQFAQGVRIDGDDVAIALTKGVEQGAKRGDFGG